MKLYFTVLLGFAAYFPSVGQHSLGMKVNYGQSKISNSFELTESYPSHSVRFGMYYSYHFVKSLIIGSELLFDQVEGSDKTIVPVVNNSGILTGETCRINFYRHISYVSLPVYLGFNVKRLTVIAGVKVALEVESSGRAAGAFYSGDITEWSIRYNNLMVDRYDYGLNFGLIYRVTGMVAVEGNYYYGVNNIVADGAVENIECKVQQVTLGLRFSFLSKQDL